MTQLAPPTARAADLQHPGLAPPRRRAGICTVLALVASGLVGGCVGQVGKTGPDDQPPGAVGGGGNRPVGGAGGGGGSAPADPLAAGVRPLLLLSAREYLNTARDLLRDTTLTEDALPSGDEDLQATPSFAFKEPHNVATQDGTLLQGAAETLARNAVAHLATLLPCATPPAAGAAETTCLNTFLTTFMPKVYRRPLTTTETAHLMSLYATGRSTLALGFNDAIGLLLEAALQSPQFLYHWELDPANAVPAAGTVVKLGNYELANRLSYFLWGTMPDTALFAAAAAGQLGDPAVVETQVRRMLADAKASDAYLNFFTDFLDLDTLADTPKSSAVYAMFPALAGPMASEIKSFVTGIMGSTGGFADLMTGTNSYANQALASFYGVSGVTGTALKPVMLNPAQRAGILTSGAFLALSGDTDESNPPRRGKAIYTKFLCGVMPPPPNNVPKPADASAGGTMRQRMEVHDQNPCAGSCHRIIEPLGFAFEEYGGIGEFRTVDNNAPVDSSGTIVLDGQTHPYSNAPELVKLLAASDSVKGCFATQWLRYAFGRAETPADQASLNAATGALTSTGDIRELIVALTRSRTFMYRTATAMEGVLK
ncbi:MAG TPA: DUF1592 domain-containing protein [Polyangia bacterium]|jgi:hypothetical protein|nr:DUF1592 domain-containing protein [Polyangia bacterium]